MATETVIPGKFRRKGESGQYKCKDLAGQHNSLSPLETVQSRTKVVGHLRCFTQCERGPFVAALYKIYAPASYGRKTVKIVP
jgi:hypothetical protein